jgi:neopullulanase
MPDTFTTPEWVKNAVFYQIFPDRFASSTRVIKPGNLEPWDSPPTVHGFKGGDLLGVAEHLDYLQDLGITAIYFNPIFQSASNHRYHTHDYYHVDPLLGGNAAFSELLKTAHERNIRIVLDGVFNHASRGFFQFNHILECGPTSPYVDWFDVRDYPLNAYEGAPNYRCWVNLPALPEFNTKNLQVRQFIFDVARYWLDQGIDGWRLDVPFCIDDDAFWQEFRQVVKAANPEAYIVGEIPWEAQRWLQGDQFDAVMNYQFTLACLGFFGGEALDQETGRGMMGFTDLPVMDAAACGQRLDDLLSLYLWEAALAQLNLLDSHDTPRFLSLARGDKAALRLATLVQMTYPGAPCIYYGDEIGLSGGGDPDCRRAFPWDISQWDAELWDFFKQCISLRRAHPALRTGDYFPLYAQDNVIAYLRQLDDEKLIVAVNNDRASQTVALPITEYLPDGAHLKALTGGSDQEVAGSAIHLTLPAREGIVWLYQ